MKAVILFVIFSILVFVLVVGSGIVVIHKVTIQEYQTYTNFYHTNIEFQTWQSLNEINALPHQGKD